MKAEDLTGKRFGNLVVVKLAGSHKKLRQWECICDCGNKKIIYGKYLKREFTRSCGCLAHPSKNVHKSWKGYGEIPRDFYTSIKRNAKNRNIEFDISIEFLWNLFLEQDRKCALSGIKLFFGKTNRDNINKTVSIDRINNDKGYVNGNVQWVHKWINIMKNDLYEKEFISFCKKIAKYKK